MRRSPRPLIHFLYLGIGFVVSCVATAFADSPAPDIRAEDLEVDFKSGEAIYSGHATAIFGAINLTADQLRWQDKTRTVVAKGNAILQRGDIRLLASELTYQVDTQAFTVVDLRFGRSPVFISGDLLEGTPQQLTFHNATASLGEPHPWSPTIKARTLTYFPDRDRLKTDHGRLGLGLFPFFPLPGTELPTDLPWIDDLTFDAGFSGRLGPHLLVGANVPVSDLFRAGADIGLYTKRGVMAGPTFSYATSTGPESFVHGDLTSGYIHDTGQRLTDVLGQQIPRDRSLITWSHRQAWAEGLAFNAELNYWSDSEVLRDFRARDFFPVQTPDSFAEVAHTTSNTVTGLFFRAQPNTFHSVRQRLPELTFDLLPTPIAAGWVQEAHAAVAVLRDRPVTGGATVESDRSDLYYALTKPWSPNAWSTINPVIGGRLTHYAKTTGGERNYTRVLGEFGLDAEMRASAIFDFKNERWGIDGLRHLITPKLSYRYIPDIEKGAAYIPSIDRQVFATYLEPLALGSRRQIDDLSSGHTLRLAIDQRLQTRDAASGSRDLAALNVAIDSRFDRPAGEPTLSALHTELRLSPAPFLDLEVYHRATPSDWTMRELNTAITLKSANSWRLQLASHFLQNDIQELIAGFSYRLNEVYEGYTQLHYDSRHDRFVERTFGVRQNIANRWIVGYEVSFYEGPRRESNFGFNVVLDAIRF